MAEKVHRSDPLENLYVVRKRIGLPHFDSSDFWEKQPTTTSWRFQQLKVAEIFKNVQNFRLQNEGNLVDSPLESRLTDDTAS